MAKRNPAVGIIDLHSHVMPAVDDGATSESEARAALRSLADEGVVTVVATPHFDGSCSVRGEVAERRLSELDEGWRTLSRIAGEVGVDVRRGAEIALDVPEPALGDARLRLGGGRFVLVEFPHMTVPPQSTRVIEYLRRHDCIPVVAHPERYAGVDAALELPRAWRTAGAYLQVNGPSLLGRYGEDARKSALGLLANGLADYLSSDFHARGRAGVRSARDALRALDGSEQAELLMETNPGRLLAGLAPIPVPPLPARAGLLGRLAVWRR
jgi:protein-tyrosine phosphatase